MKPNTQLRKSPVPTMTDLEYTRWMVNSKAGWYGWIVDCIHDGTNGSSLWIYKPLPADPTKGIIVEIGQDGSYYAGTYSGAIENIGDRMTQIGTEGKHNSFAEAAQHLIDNRGLAFIGYFI